MAGATNVFEQATRVDTVRRVVATSSVAAIYTDATECAEAPGGVLTEDAWKHQRLLWLIAPAAGPGRPERVHHPAGIVVDRSSSLTWGHR